LIDDADVRVLDLIERQRKQLSICTQSAPKRWLGSLRRSTLARTIQGSNSIEGYHATLDEALAVVGDEQPRDERSETWLAIRGYRNALTYLIQAVSDPYFAFTSQLIKSLHFMMLGHELSMRPGQWRAGPVFVVDERTDKTVYEAPDAEAVNALIEELVSYLAEVGTVPAIVRAAMAHLNLTMIHPFRDGNGRMARALQTMVISLDGVLHPVFSSIEEWLGQNTQDYYAVLAATGQGRWNPSRNARPWLRFCLKAHYQQAATLIRRNDEYALLYEKVVALLARTNMPERAAVPVFDTVLGFSVTNVRYRSDAEVAELTASRDLKKLCDAGVLVAIGERRGRTYRAVDELRRLRETTRLRRVLDDPYVLRDVKRRRERDK
jgi:Fic family protein